MNKIISNKRYVIFTSAVMAGTMICAPVSLNYAAQNNIGVISSTARLNSLFQINGWLESAGVEWKAIDKATGYNVYYKSTEDSKASYIQLDNELIRSYSDYFRADILGLKEGKYVVKIVPIIDGKANTTKQIITNEFEVKAHTREGFAFSKESTMRTGSGGYNDDGTVPSNSQILYVNAKNVNTISLDVITSSKGTKTKCTGLANILNSRAKGYDKTPLIIRLTGEIKASDIQGLNSNGYLQLKGIYNTTLEGVGKDATINGWGLLVRNSKNIEIRNLGIMLFPDDAISLDTGNENIWVHNNDIFYGAAGSDADQVKGDGSTDIKGKSTYVTISYNKYWDSGKVSLCGMTESAEFFVTYHHNWFLKSDSRHPRIRVGTVHIYNNYFDGNSKYGVGVTMGGSAFVEANDFSNCKYPMLISQQGSDIAGNSKGTFSGEDGGMIKAYNNKIAGATRLVYAQENGTQFDAYLAKDRNEQVSSKYKSVKGGNTYNNFDTNSSMYEYKADRPEDVKEVVTTYAGRTEGGDFEWEFTSADDKSSSVNKDLMEKIKKYKSELVSIGGNSIITILPNEDVKPSTPSVPDKEESTPNTPSTPDKEESTPSAPDKEESIPNVSSTVVHNFTKDGKNSSFFTIKGNLSSTKGTVVYDGLTLKDCLKIESSTNIKFKTSKTQKLTLVFNSNFNKAIKIDGKEYKAKDGVLTVDLKAGDHTITKGDTGNLYYIKLA